MTPGLFILFVMLAALGSGIWIGFALLGTGVIALEWYRDMPIARVLAQDIWAFFRCRASRCTALGFMAISPRRTSAIFTSRACRASAQRPSPGCLSSPRATP